MGNLAKQGVWGIEAVLAENGLDRDWQLWQQRLEAVNCAEAERAIAAGGYSQGKILALVSPAAEKYLEQMAQTAQRVTVQRFGRTIRLYAPLYLSNFCVNSCRYCGFSSLNTLLRKRLAIEQAVDEAQIIAEEGFRDILLVSSEDREFVSVEYLAELAGRLRKRFSFIGIEVYPMETQDYRRLFEAGIEGVTIYQETYNRAAYQYYHPAGPKSDYDRRLATAERAAGAGMRQIGIGALLGLEDWRVETLAMAEHAHYLSKHYWQSQVSFSFPRLRPAGGVEQTDYKHKVSDRNFVQMMTALRLCFPDAGLVLSTRERDAFRDKLAGLGVTKMSAGSKTNPGGYSGKEGAAEQFEVNDTRSPSQVAAMLRKLGFEPVWKDWDSSFSTRGARG